MRRNYNFGGKIKNNNICKNCKFWAASMKEWAKKNGYDPYLFGDELCNKLKEVLNISIEVNGNACADVDEIYTKFNFGCNLFEEF